MNKFQFNERYSQLILLFILITITAFIHENGLHGDFILDDINNIVSDPSLKADKLNYDSIAEVILNKHQKGHFRPIPVISFFLNAHFFGIDNTYSFKLVNLIIHLINAILVFFLSKKLIELFLKKETSDKLDTQLLPFFIALIWAAHPMNISGVAYIVQRMTSLASLFTFLGLIFFVESKLQSNSGIKTKIVFLFGLLCCTVLGVLCKENAILVIPMCGLIHILSNKNQWNLKGNIYNLFFLIFLIIPGLLVATWILFNFDFILEAYKFREFTMIERLLTQPRVLVTYLQQIIFPISQNFSLFHDDLIISKSFFEPLTTMLSALFLLLVFTAAIKYREKFPIYSFGILFFLIGHSIESTILGLEMVFEHRNYTPSFGILFALVFAAFQLINRNNLVGWASLGSMSLYIGFVGYSQSSIWGDTNLQSEILFANQPKSFRAAQNLARRNAWYVEKEGDKLHKRTLELASLSAELNKASILPHMIKIHFANRFNKPVESYVIDDMKNRLSQFSISSSNANALYALSNSASRNEDFLSIETRLSLIETAIRNPKITKSLLSVLWFSKAKLHLKEGNLDLYVKATKEGLKLAPKHFEVRKELILILAQNGYFEEAKDNLNRLEGLWQRVDKQEEIDYLHHYIESKIFNEQG